MAFAEMTDHQLQVKDTRDKGTNAPQFEGKYFI